LHLCRSASFFPWLVKGPSMGRMTWDLATLQYHRWAGRAGWEAYSDYRTPSTGDADSESRYVSTCHGGRRRPTMWPFTYRSSMALLPGTSESTVNRINEPVDRTCDRFKLPEAVPRRSRSRIFTPADACRTSSTKVTVRIYRDVIVSCRLLTSPDSVWNHRVMSGVDVRIGL
jgi:hypothetical protein